MTTSIPSHPAESNLTKPSLRACDLLLPANIPAVTGKEINLYFDNLIIGDATRYDFVVRCAIGRHQNERWTCVPTELGNVPLTVEVYSEEGVLLSAADTVVQVKATDGNGGSRTILFVGDSTTAAGAYTAELLRLFALDSDNLKLIGKQGTAPNVHEGLGGWRVDSFFEKEGSPFVFGGAFNFCRYMRDNGFEDSGLTDLCVHLGINDVWLEKDDEAVAKLLEREMPMLESMFESVWAYDASIRIGIMIVIPPSLTQDSFGASYGTRQTRRRYKRNVFLWNQELIRRFGNREGFELVPVNVNLDTVNSMPSELVPANSRSSVTIRRLNNGVHPAQEGYKQMADVLYYWLK
ncbi:SGNH/GDSL hydrolase family protein [Paenibacillus mesophilus]|uniref:SGNH/GDSL hydrolase family protein n=1 Tax=Paenibacillus mesophilus TaxID=2582849 RepID=UPI00110EC74C|nr:SGNH/GDSL hydrolase family protein [Paenibacillus mesophilus]TMV43038.1 SGNH/GDSL hydrolase family protein [Paenibacillus mesophilus]